jgi:hypothetical protein
MLAELRLLAVAAAVTSFGLALRNIKRVLQ